jgi:hypothetical protein
MKENYLFFAEDTLGASATAACYKASDFISAFPSATTKITLCFKSSLGTATADLVELTFTTAGAHANAMKAVARAMNNPANVRSNFNVIYDGVNSLATPIEAYHGTTQAFTAVDITIQ